LYGPSGAAFLRSSQLFFDWAQRAPLPARQVRESAGSTDKGRASHSGKQGVRLGAQAVSGEAEKRRRRVEKNKKYNKSSLAVDYDN